MIIRVVDGTEREMVVRRIGTRWVANNTAGKLCIGLGTTAADAISDLLQIPENGDE